jgi:hypothetical protein
MSITMHSASVTPFVRMLKNMLAWLDKAETFAKAKGFDVNNFVGLRLAPDMHPLARQIQIASDACKGCVARLTGVEAPKWADDESTFDELRERIRKTIAFAESAPAASFEGSDAKDITLQVPGRDLHFSGEAFLTNFALPNFFFHVVTTYALLRHGGGETRRRVPPVDRANNVVCTGLFPAEAHRGLTGARVTATVVAERAWPTTSCLTDASGSTKTTSRLWSTRCEVRT